MFVPDKLLIEKAQIAALPMLGAEACAISAPLAAPFRPLRLAVFNGPEGGRLAVQARETRRLGHEGRDYRVIADLSAHLGRQDVLVVEPA